LVQTGNENRHVVTASGKVLKRGNGTNSGSTTNKPTTTAAAEEPPVRDAVFMGTVHQAKGLEWPVVLVVRFNEEEFPLVCNTSAIYPSFLIPQRLCFF